ncbi:hypothetical protein G7072_04085 [Nocardioides sp. HDW12B]|nr:hypothetical protein G7072_04085 [Nocardioides sp. HDW12B]
MRDSALRHGCSREDISHAYDLFLIDRVIEPDTEPPKLLFVGPDEAGNLLELVGGELNGELWIWHAMKCRPQYLQLLAGAGRKR